VTNKNPKGLSDLRPPEHRGAMVDPFAPTTTPGGQPYIDPGAAPAVAAYIEQQAARVAAQRGVQLPKYSEPVGGGMGPTIPRLDAPHTSGHTMTSQAEQVNSPPMQQQMAAAHAKLGGNSIVEAPLLAPHMQPQQQAPPTNPMDQARQMGLQPTDMLPPEAQSDPSFQMGNGAMFAVSQPALAHRYGVIRNGQKIVPQQLQTQQPQQQQGGQGVGALRPETLQGLAAIEEQRRRQSPEAIKEAEDKAEKQIEGTAASFSANAGEPPKKSKDAKEVQDEMARKLELLDSFDYDALRQSVEHDVLNNPGQRELIEKRLEGLSIDDLIIKNQVSQRVPIIPGRFEVTYTSMSGDDDLALKRLLMQESRSVEVTERYLFDKYAFMALTAGVTAVNGNVLPRHVNEKEEFDEDLFMRKFEWVMKRPLHMLSSIGVNHTWFEGRVRKLFVAQKVGNI